MSNSEAIALYTDFRSKLDALVAEAWLQYGSQMQCKKGCSQCCRGDFQITLIEAQVLSQAIRKADEQTQTAIEAALMHHSDDRCALLDEQGACLLYEARPILCRIFGFPIRIPPSPNSEEHIATCELNFKNSQNTEFQAKCFDKATIQDVLKQISHLAVHENPDVDQEPQTFFIADVVRNSLA